MARSKETTISKPKFTAADIEKDCPDRLQQMGKQIAARLEKIDKQIVQAENHSISVNQLITQAKELCDEGGFNAFREKFFPNLGKSRVYELLAIGTNKKSIKEVRADNRARVAKHRANKAATFVSVTVTEKWEPGAKEAPQERGEVEAQGVASEQIPELVKPQRSVSPGDRALIDFSSAVRWLIQITTNKKAERYARTSVSADELARLGTLLTDVASLKMSRADGLALPGKSAASGEQSAVNAEHAALETSIDPVA